MATQKIRIQVAGEQNPGGTILSKDFEKLNLDKNRVNSFNNFAKDKLERKSSNSGDHVSNTTVSYNVINAQAALHLHDLYFTLMAIMKFKNRLNDRL